MINLLRSFLEVFTPKIRPSATTKVREKGPNFDYVPSLFFIIGHNKRNRGAFNGSEFEYDFSLRGSVAFLENMDSLCPKIPVFSIERTLGTYKSQIKAITKKIKRLSYGGASFSLHSHFNGGEFSGCETLTLPDKNHFPRLLGENLGKAMKNTFNINPRRAKGVWFINSNHSASPLLKSLEGVRCYGAIIEPVFSKSLESKAFFQREGEYWRLLAETVTVSYLLRGLIEKKDIQETLEYWNISGPRVVVKVK